MVLQDTSATRAAVMQGHVDICTGGCIRTCLFMHTPVAGAAAIACEDATT